MSRFFSKLLISFLVAFSLFASITPAAMAQSTTTTSGPWYNQNYSQWSAKVFGGDQNEIFGERYTYAQVNWIINSLTAVIIGSDISKCVTAGATGNLSQIGVCANALYTFPSANPTAGFSGGGITGLAYLTGSLVAFKPASGVGYIKTTASNLHIIPHAYAQSTGAGYNTLSPIQSLWGVMRDISYALMVVVIIAMAFMIMFRVKISPQVIVTVQSALPRVVIALILITFSYAIAGLLVDLMNVIIGLFAVMIKISPSANISSGTVTYLFGQLNSLNGLVSLTIGFLLLTVILAVGGFLFTTAGIVGTVTILGLPIGILGGLILLIGVVFVFWTLLRLFWLMLRTSVMTVLLIVISPVAILGETLSIGGGFWGWFKTVLANLAVYPTVSIMIFISHYFFWGWAVGSLTQLWPSNNPLNTYAINSLNLNGGSSVIGLPGMPVATFVIGFGAALMTVFLIPQASQVIQGLITGKGINAGAAAGAAIGPAIGVLTGGINTASGLQKQRYEESQRFVLSEAAKGRTAAIPPSLEREKDAWNFLRGVSGGRIK